MTMAMTLTKTLTNEFQHPDADFLLDPVAFDVVMRKRELMMDLRLVGRMRSLEIKYERYEKLMKEMYRHEDDWARFDESEDYY